LSLSADAIRLLAAKGLSVEDIAQVAEANEDGPKRSANAERQARYRARKSGQTVTSNVTRNADENVTSNVTERNNVTPLVRVVNNLSKIVKDNTQVDKSTFVEPVSETDAVTLAPKAKRGSRLPENWQPTPDDIAFAESEGFTHPEIHREAAQFRDYWHARADKGAVKLNWSQTWRNRIRDRADGRSRMATPPRQSSRQRQVAASFADVVAKRRAEAPVSDDVSAEWRVL
jgi:hypothetical protein